jgi:hypothetical protein
MQVSNFRVSFLREIPSPPNKKNSPMYTNLSATFAADFLKDGETVVSDVKRKIRPGCVAPCVVETSKSTKGEPAGLPDTMGQTMHASLVQGNGPSTVQTRQSA